MSAAPDTPVDTFTRLVVAERDRDKAQSEVRSLRGLLADAERDGRAWCEQLGVVQARCSELIEEARAARRELAVSRARECNHESEEMLRREAEAKTMAHATDGEIEIGTIDGDAIVVLKHKMAPDDFARDLFVRCAELHARQQSRIDTLTSSLEHLLLQEASTEDGLGLGWECAGCADHGFVAPVQEPEEIEHVDGCPLYETK